MLPLRYAYGAPPNFSYRAREATSTGASCPRAVDPIGRGCDRYNALTRERRVLVPALRTCSELPEFVGSGTRCCALPAHPLSVAGEVAGLAAARRGEGVGS